MSIKNITNEDVANFYDNYTSRQKKVGANIRIRGIFLKLLKEGLNKNSSVLEIGCGVGILTQLISSVVTKGRIVSTDISAASIKEAKQRNQGKKNIRYFVDDMTSFGVPEKFDFVVLADVLEHIPIENHFNLFNTIKSHTHLSSKIAINIPSPFHIKWLEANEPEILQVIDQPLFLQSLIPSFEGNDMYIQELKSYSLFHNFADYQWMILTPGIKLSTIKHKPRMQLIKQELFSRFAFIISKFR